jgi:hypothetical protein
MKNHLPTSVPAIPSQKEAEKVNLPFLRTKLKATPG